MERREIMQKAIQIILRHAKPERIYLYGSEANGEATQTSDIDIAYDAPGFKKDYLIQDELQDLRTLTHIDVKNLAETEKRFQSRVKSTGRVLYSANKHLRAEDGLYNFTKAYNKLNEAIEMKKDLYEEGFDSIYLDLIVKRFEFTYEMSWKALKRYLASVGMEALNPKSCFKEAYAQKLIADEKVWLDMLEQRNLSSHIYDENEIKDILLKIEGYSVAFSDLKRELGKRLSQDL